MNATDLQPGDVLVLQNPEGFWTQWCEYQRPDPDDPGWLVVRMADAPGLYRVNASFVKRPGIVGIDASAGADAGHDADSGDTRPVAKPAAPPASKAAADKTRHFRQSRPPSGVSCSLWANSGATTWMTFDR